MSLEFEWDEDEGPREREETRRLVRGGQSRSSATHWPMTIHDPRAFG